MKGSDYDLMLHICYYSLRKGTDLTIDQVSDIDRMIKKLHQEKYTRFKINANLRNKKVGQNKRLRSN